MATLASSRYNLFATNHTRTLPNIEENTRLMQEITVKKCLH